jgi:predicted acyltransferase
LPAAATALIGAVTGQLMQRAGSGAARLSGLAITGAVAFALGWAWSQALPLNKPLWTGSYVLVAAGLATLTFALTYFMVDVRGVRRWSRPFLWLGVNPLAIYFLSELARHLLDRAWIQQGGGWTTPKAWLFWEIAEPALRPAPVEWLSFAFGSGFVAMAIAVAGVLYRCRIRIRV